MKFSYHPTAILKIEGKKIMGKQTSDTKAEH